jgi:RNase H-fold protein (predicted Holliday junction resolvase)
MMGGSRRKRAGHLDDLAATVILQSFLDAQSVDKESSE